MIFTKSTADQLIKELAENGRTIQGDDHSFDKTIRLIEYGPWTLIMTTSNTISLFEDKKIIYTVLVKDTAHEVSDILVKAYDREEIHTDLFEYL